MKTVGREVEENFWSSYYASGAIFKHDGGNADHGSVTPTDCLRLYELTGGYVAGPVEVRSTWKYAQIDPRIYYARGGSVMPSSHYLQPIVNRIIDAFPETHRLNRFSPPSQPLSPEDVEFIYDYSSFTSALDPVVEFVRNLALFFRGTTVIILDVRDGLVERDLGDMLDDYNRNCNDYIGFDASRVLSRWVNDKVELTHTCGMLGVEGNIFLATLLHGIHLRFISGLERSKCVGDDARFHHDTEHGVLTPDDKSLVSWQLNGLGDANKDKFGIFESGKDPLLQAYRYVKRPIHRDLDIMVEGLMLDIPSLIPLFELADQYHDVIPSSTHPCRQAFKSICRILRILKLHRITVDDMEEDIQALRNHIFFLRDEIIRQDPDGIHSPVGRSDIRSRYSLPPVTVWGKYDYEDWTLMNLGVFDEIRFLKCGGSDENEVCDGRIGSTMVKETNAKRSFLVKMGYLQREDLYDTVSINQIGLDGMRVYLSGMYRVVCKYTVMRTIPSWYSQVPRCL